MFQTSISLSIYLVTFVSFQLISGFSSEVLSKLHVEVQSIWPIFNAFQEHCNSSFFSAKFSLLVFKINYLFLIQTNSLMMCYLMKVPACNALFLYFNPSLGRHLVHKLRNIFSFLFNFTFIQPRKKKICYLA